MGEHERERQLCLSAIIELAGTVWDCRTEIRAICEQPRLALQVFSWQRQMKRRGLQRNTAYLVRPDGYLAVVAPPDQTEIGMSLSANSDLRRPRAQFRRSSSG